MYPCYNCFLINIKWNTGSPLLLMAEKFEVSDRDTTFDLSAASFPWKAISLLNAGGLQGFSM